jgi:hypothetical protein
MHKAPEMVVPLHGGITPSWLHTHTARDKAVSQRYLRIIDDYQGLWGRRNPTLGQEICLVYPKRLQDLFQLLPVVVLLTNPTQGSLQFRLRCNCMFTAKAHGRSETWVNWIRTPDGTLYFAFARRRCNFGRKNLMSRLWTSSQFFPQHCRLPVWLVSLVVVKGGAAMKLNNSPGFAVIADALVLGLLQPTH